MTTLWKIIVDLINSIEREFAFLCFLGVHLPGVVRAVPQELLLHFHSAATQSIQQVWTADKRQACKSPFCMSDFDEFVCLKKLEVIKAEQKRLFNTFRKKNHVWFFLMLLDYFVGFVVVCLG